MATTTNPESIPGFNSVAESRERSEATECHLFAVSREERMADLSAARARYLPGKNEHAAQNESCAIREEPPEKEASAL